jgi:hypothetical protein
MQGGTSFLPNCFEGPTDAGQLLEGPADVPPDSSPGYPLFLEFGMELFACSKTREWAEALFRGTNLTK